MKFVSFAILSAALDSLREKIPDDIVEKISHIINGVDQFKKVLKYTDYQTPCEPFDEYTQQISKNVGQSFIKNIFTQTIGNITMMLFSYGEMYDSGYRIDKFNPEMKDERYGWFIARFDGNLLKVDLAKELGTVNRHDVNGRSFFSIHYFYYSFVEVYDENGQCLAIGRSGDECGTIVLQQSSSNGSTIPNVFVESQPNDIREITMGTEIDCLDGYKLKIVDGWVERVEIDENCFESDLF